MATTAASNRAGSKRGAQKKRSTRLVDTKQAPSVIAEAKQKAPAPAKEAKAAKAAKAPKRPAFDRSSGSAAKPRVGHGATKAKLVRDSFTMPQPDFDLIATLKDRAIKFGRPAKKSEILRAGLKALAALDDASLRAVLDALVPIKTGRPTKT
jgi:hypothetical protein